MKRYYIQWNRYELGLYSYNGKTGEEHHIPPKNVGDWQTIDSNGYYFLNRAQKRLHKFIGKGHRWPCEYRIIYYDKLNQEIKVVYHLKRMDIRSYALVV